MTCTITRSPSSTILAFSFSICVSDATARRSQTGSRQCDALVPVAPAPPLMDPATLRQCRPPSTRAPASLVSTVLAHSVAGAGRKYFDKCVIRPAPSPRERASELRVKVAQSDAEPQRRTSTIPTRSKRSSRLTRYIATCRCRRRSASRRRIRRRTWRAATNGSDQSSSAPAEVSAEFSGIAAPLTDEARAGQRLERRR